MFDTVRNNKKLVQIFLALITLPFAFWGVESYVRNAGNDGDAAKVGDSRISVAEFQSRLRDEQERMRTVLGGRADPAMMDSPQIRQAVLDTLVNERLVALQASKGRLMVGDGQLAQIISAEPSLQEGGKFSPERYAAFVATQGMSKEMFEARFRQRLTEQQAIQPVGLAVIPGRTGSRPWVSAQLEKREIAELRLNADEFLGQVKLAEGAAKTFYETNRKQFETPELVRVDYLMLNQEDVAKQVAVGDEELRARYQQRADKYREGETRRASHILIQLPKGAPEAEARAARAKAEGLLAQVRKAPAEFARLAQQHSQDPGSAKNGGDLDWFGKGAMVKPFEEAVFALKEGQVSDIVQSDFGLHIIRLTGVRAERSKPFDEVKAELAAELRGEQVARKFGEAAEGFGNIVYEQADSLKPAADKYRLAILQSGWIARGRAQPPFDHTRLQEKLFAEDAIKNRRNTESVEIASGKLVSARVVEHKPASLQPFETVREAIEKRLVRDEAGKLAQKAGEERLAALRKGENADGRWGAPRTVMRAAATGLSPETVSAVFAADATRLPAYAGMAQSGGYALFRVTAVTPHDADKDEAAGRGVAQQYQRVVAEAEFMAWMASLREQFPVTLNKAAIEKADRQ